MFRRLLSVSSFTLLSRITGFIRDICMAWILGKGLLSDAFIVAFLFPNQHDVYLHGTPAPQLFEKSRRDFSHGCIRAEKPQQLAEWVMQNQPEWTPERIAQAMNGEETIHVRLKKPIPVLIVYATAVVLESGEVRFFDDIYGQDATLAKTLESRGKPTSGGRGQRPHE